MRDLKSLLLRLCGRTLNRPRLRTLIAVGVMCLSTWTLALATAAARAPTRRPTPTRFEASVPDLPRVPPPYEVISWNPWSVAADGTIYGFADNNRVRQMFKAKVGQPGEWLWRDEPLWEHWLPSSANSDGYVIVEDLDALYGEGYFAFLFHPQWGEPRDLRHLHPDGFLPVTLNEQNVLAGTVGFRKGGDIVGATYSTSDGFTLYSGAGLIQEIGPTGTVIGSISGIPYQQVTYRVWHADGRESEFTVPYRTLVGIVQINSRDEVVGYHTRQDNTGDYKIGGWKWSESEGFIEIPFLHHGLADAYDVQVYGITEDGWVFGNQAYYPIGGPLPLADGFLWRGDAGVFRIADLYDWEQSFLAAMSPFGSGFVNDVNQLVLENVANGANASHPIILTPTLTPVLLITPDPLRSNTETMFNVCDGAPSVNTGVFYSIRGRGETFVPDLNVTLQLADAVPIDGFRVTDANGCVEWTVPAPTVSRRRDVWFQVAQETGHLSVPIMTAIRP